MYSLTPSHTHISLISGFSSLYHILLHDKPQFHLISLFIIAIFITLGLAPLLLPLLAPTPLPTALSFGALGSCSAIFTAATGVGFLGAGDGFGGAGLWVRIVACGTCEDSLLGVGLCAVDIGVEGFLRQPLPLHTARSLAATTQRAITRPQTLRFILITLHKL